MFLRVIYTSSILFFATLISYSQLLVGAEQTNRYIPLLKGKNIALVVNPTSLIKTTHLVDSLLNDSIAIKTIFAPEHGFRGDADAGEHVANGKDKRTGLPIVSLYGSNKKPTSDQLKGIDVVVFDIQDVGARFYTYISTMHYVMEACAENNIPLIILDRPNPNGMYVDGPVLKKEFKSFVGMHAIPVLHGLTIGELAQMINGEKWLENGVSCDLTIITCLNYTHNSTYSLPVKPSPNLPTDKSIQLYASLCFFEGTIISVGRGTELPFEVIGHPSWKTDYHFTPTSLPGASNPPYKDQKCDGLSLRNETTNGLALNYLIKAYELTPDKTKFFSSPSFFNKLVGNNELIQQIKTGKTEQEIRATWEPELSEYKKMREQYLLYP